MTTTARRRFGVPILPLLVLLLLAACGGCGSGPVPDTEFVIQAETLHEAALRSTVVTDADLSDYLAEIGKRIIQGATNTDAKYTREPTFANMQFHLVGSPIPNAFTTGGRHVYVYSGLLLACRTEEELAAVMAHEFAHAVNLDVQHLGMTPNAAATADRIAYSFVSYEFTPEMQQKADDDGVAFYSRGGWDPARFSVIFERLQNDPGLIQQAGGAANLAPLTQRASAARERATRLPAAARNWRQPPVADAQTFDFLRKNASKAAGEAASPQNAAWLFLRAFPNCLLPFDLPAQQAAKQQLKALVTPPAVPAPHPEPS